MSILRYITDNIGELPVSVLSALLESNGASLALFFNLHFADVIQLLVEVVEKRPWDKIVSGQRQRWKDGIWVAINSDEVPQICKMEAQVWLALNNLLVDQTFRLKYKFTSSNKAIILRVLKTIYCVAYT